MLLAFTASLVLFNIPAGQAHDTLRTFAHQSDFNILFPSDEVATQVTHAVHGMLDPRKAIEIMLHNTGLESQFRHPNNVMVSTVDNRQAENRHEVTEPPCKCILLSGFARIPYCDDGGPKIHFREECR